MFYFPLFAAIGSVLGCWLLYSIMRRGGQAVLRRRFKRENIERVERAYARYGFLAIAIPAVLPPPMPFKIFVATAGTLEYPRWKFLVTVMIARSFRYYVEGILAVFYGRRVLLFLKDNGLVIAQYRRRRRDPVVARVYDCQSPQDAHERGPGGCRISLVST